MGMARTSDTYIFHVVCMGLARNSTIYIISYSALFMGMSRTSRIYDIRYILNCKPAQGPYFRHR